MYNDIRIAVAGTHSSGKTSFAKALADAAHIEYVRGDQAKEIAAELGNHGKHVRQLNVADQKTLQLRMLKGLWPKSGSSYVTDGTPLSCIAYGKALIGEAFEGFAQKENFLKRVFEAASGYDVVFYLPPEIGLRLDGFRPPENAFQWEMDTEVRKLLPKEKTRTLTGSIADRVTTALYFLGKANAPPRANHIVVEGLPRSGKTSVIESIKSFFNKQNCKRDVFYPTRYDFSPSQKSLTLPRRLELYKDPLSNRNELLGLFVNTFLYDQCQNHVSELLARNAFVISDRQKFSIIANMRGLNFSWGELYYATRELPTPGTVIFIDVDPEASVERSRKTQSDNLLKTNLDFQGRVSEAYRELCRQHPEFIRIDGNQDLERITSDCLGIIEERTLRL